MRTTIIGASIGVVLLLGAGYAILWSRSDHLEASGSEQNFCSTLGSGPTTLDTQQNLLSGNKSPIPQCKELILKEAPIITMDDVVQNCSYQDGKSWYDDRGGGGRYSTIILFQDQALTPLYSLPIGTEEVCQNSSEGGMGTPDTAFHPILNIINTYHIKEKQLLKIIRPVKEEIAYHCINSGLCEQLRASNRGNKHGHYFLYGQREYEDKDNFVILMDDVLYNPGKIKKIVLDNEEEVNIQQGPRNIVDIQPNKAIVQRYIDGQLLEPYKSNPQLLETIAGGTIISRFKLETCEIPL